MLVIIVELF